MVRQNQSYSPITGDWTLALASGRGDGAGASALFSLRQLADLLAVAGVVGSRAEEEEQEEEKEDCEEEEQEEEEGGSR